MDDDTKKAVTDPKPAPGEAGQPGALEDEKAADAGDDVAIELPLEPGDANGQPS